MPAQRYGLTGAVPFATGAPLTQKAEAAPAATGAAPNSYAAQARNIIDAQYLRLLAI